MKDNALDTKCHWDKTERKWLCSFCGAEPVTRYVVTGHDHTDESHWTCECRRATLSTS